MRIHNTRSLFEEDKNGNKKVNEYYDGFLAEGDKAWCEGYDGALKEAKDFLYNLESYADDFAEIGLDVTKVDVDKILDDKEHECNPETAIVGMIYECLAKYLESCRNEYVVAMLDGMSEEEYEAKRKEVLEHENIAEG